MRQILFLVIFLSSVFASDLASEFANAKRLYNEAKYNEAWAKLIKLIKKDPTNKSLNILMLQTANKSGRVNQALAILERLVMLEPNNITLRKELAKSYANLGDTLSAEHEVEVLKGIEPSLIDSGFEYDIAKRSKASKKRFDNFTYNARLALGLSYNSNVNTGIDELGVRVGGLDLELNDEAKKRSSFGEYANLNTNLAYKLSPNWHLVGDINALFNGYNKKVSQNKYYGYARLGSGLRYTGDKAVVDVRLKGENHWQHPKESIGAFGAEASFVYAFNKNYQAISKLSFERRKYSKYDEKNGNFSHAGVYLRYLWANDGWVMLGARLIKNKSNEDYYAYNGYEGILRLSFSPLSRLDIMPFVSYKEQRYKAAASKLSARLGEDNRIDKAIFGGVITTWHWSQSLATELGYQYIKNRSNSDFYKYSRHQVNLGMVFNF